MDVKKEIVECYAYLNKASILYLLLNPQSLHMPTNRNILKLFMNNVLKISFNETKPIQACSRTTPPLPN